MESFTQKLTRAAVLLNFTHNLEYLQFNDCQTIEQIHSALPTSGWLHLSHVMRYSRVSIEKHIVWALRRFLLNTRVFDVQGVNLDK